MRGLAPRLTLTMLLACCAPSASAAKAGSKSWMVAEIAGLWMDSLCARFEGGSIWCVGHDGAGRFTRVAPVALPGPAIDLDGDGITYCAVIAGGSVSCWGDPTGVSWSATPAVLAVPAPVVQVAITGHGPCVLTASRDQVWCWGVDRRRAHAATAPPVRAPLPAATFTDIEATTFGGCALETTGTLWCWSERSQSPQTSFDCPPRVVMEHVSRLVAEAVDLCVVTRPERAVYCLRRFGEATGPSPPRACALGPLQRVTVDPVLDASLGGRSVCVLFDDHRVDCWGGPFVEWSQDGSGVPEDQRRTQHIGRLEDATAVVGGGGVHCVLRGSTAPPVCIPDLPIERCLERLIERGLEGPPINCEDEPSQR